jgi:hypothetical protein
MKWCATLLILASLAGTVAAQKGEPTFVYSTFLNEITLNPEKGLLKINYLTGVNFPDEGSEGEFQYNPADGGKLTTIVKYEGYEEPFATMKWYGKKEIDPLWSFTKYDVGKTTQPKSEDGWMNFQTPGKFTMEFYLNDELMYSFPFAVSKLPGVPDQDIIDKFFLDGPWEDFSYLYYLGGRPSRNIRFVLWLRNKEHRPRKPVQVLGVLMKDGAPVAKTGEGPEEIVLTPQWQRVEFPLGSSVRNNEGALQFQPIRARNILSVDGNYELMITIDNQVYGIYPFTVLKGTIRLIQEQDPERTKSEKRIYGGEGTFWLKRKK